MQKVSLIAAALSVAVCGSASAELVYALTGSAFAASLVKFDSATPGVITTVGAISSGVRPSHNVRAIDFRPATGELYALSVGPATSGQAPIQIYKVNLNTAAFTAVGSTFNVPTPDIRPSIDFNPTVDRIRIVSGNDMNLRAHPDTGALVSTDTPLNYVAGDVNFGLNGFVNAIAYSKNRVGGGPTTMYGFDYNQNALITVGGIGGTPSPNTGGMNTVVNIDPNAFFPDDSAMGMDISSTTDIAYLNYRLNGKEEIGTLNLTTGAVTSLGQFPSNVDILDIAVVIPEPTSLALVALGGAAVLRRRK
jgi:hypothetical protein